MDKVLLGAQDIESLFKWRDAHKDEVRTNPSPVRDIEIICKESQVKVKCIREPQKLKMWVNISGKSVGHAEFTLAFTGMWHSEKNKLKLQQEDIQSCLSLYCSIAALMVYGATEEVALPERRKVNGKTGSNEKRKKQTGGCTYILHRRGAALYVGRRGAHARPKGEFSVRGHYRHYKSGKVVWINEYRKGEGKRNGKKFRFRKDELQSVQ